MNKSNRKTRALKDYSLQELLTWAAEEAGETACQAARTSLRLPELIQRPNEVLQAEISDLMDEVVDVVGVMAAVLVRTRTEESATMERIAGFEEELIRRVRRVTLDVTSLTIIALPQGEAQE